MYLEEFFFPVLGIAQGLPCLASAVPVGAILSLRTFLNTQKRELAQCPLLWFCFARVPMCYRYCSASAHQNTSLFKCWGEKKSKIWTQPTSASMQNSKKPNAVSVMCVQWLSWKQHYKGQLWLSTWMDGEIPRKLVEHWVCLCARCVCEGISGGHWWLGQLSGEHVPGHCCLCQWSTDKTELSTEEGGVWEQAWPTFLEHMPFPFFLLFLPVNTGF